MLRISNGIAEELSEKEVNRINENAVAAMRDAVEQAEAEEKRRPLSYSEVQEMLVRQQINTLSVDDQTALRMRRYYPTFAELVGQTVSYGTKFRVDDSEDADLYKTIQPELTIQAHYPPGVGTESLYTRIDETHDGTKYDPIPSSRGMEYEYGKYYLDSEDGKTYLCERIGEAAGGKIVLQYLPHELLGQYFEAAN